MRYVFLLTVLAGSLCAQVRPAIDEFQSNAGPIKVTIIYHASLMLEAGGQTIAVDPVGANRYTNLPQANVVLITHTHSDHLDPAAVAKLSRADTTTIGPASAAKTLPGLTIMK